MNKEQALQKAEGLLRKTDPNYSGTFGIREIDGVGYLVWQEVRGGGSVVIGSDGGVLFSNMTGIVAPKTSSKRTKMARDQMKGILAGQVQE